MTSLAPDDLGAAGIRTVVVCTPDLHGRLLGRRLTPTSFHRALERGVDMCTAGFAWDIEQQPYVEGVTWTGFHTGWHDVTLVPDPATLRIAGWVDGVAICLADAREVDDGTPVRVSPRAQLRAQVDALAEAGYEARVGMEYEFYLYRGAPADLRGQRFADLVPTTAQPADYSVLQADLFEEFFADVTERLARAGIAVESTQGEWGLGQWELSLHHEHPLAAADHAALCKLAVRELAARAGMTATFMARPHVDQPGSSGHVHLSLRDDGGTPVFDGRGDEPLTKAMAGALGGALAHVHDLALLYAPNVNSYRRVHAPDFAGWGRSWGYDNRTTSFRVLGAGEDRRIESRLPGADANPYLAVAALLAAARDGIATAADPGPPVRGNAYEQRASASDEPRSEEASATRKYEQRASASDEPRSEEASATRKYEQRADDASVPRHLGDAVEAFRDSEFARAQFGADVVDHYAAAGTAEWEQFLGAVTDWELLRYLELT